MNDDSLLVALGRGIVNFVISTSVLMICFGYLFCIGNFSDTCEVGMTAKNVFAFILGLAALANFIPQHWYGSVTQVLVALKELFANSDDDGIFDKVLQNKFALICITLVVVIMAVGIFVLIFGGQGGILFELVQKVLNCK